MQFNVQRAIELLQIATQNSGASFREGQQEAIKHVVEARGRLLVVQKTGWGKSFVYFIATKLLREAGSGPTLLISPLLSLMRNQLAAARNMGVRAETINSDNQADWGTIEAKVRQNVVDILLISPERLGNDHFVANVLPGIAANVGLLVVDEAHCISDWGHDFRPHYRRLERIVRTLPPQLRVLATTATANARVMTDLHSVLGPNLTVSKGDLGRPSLALQTIHLPGQAERLAWLAATLPKLPGSGIVYTLTVRDADEVTAWLRSRGILAAAYSGQVEGRVGLEDDLLTNKLKALVATSALGMGFDKPDLSFVVHYQTPGSVVAYYQQVGRAGRALTEARGVLLRGDGDATINEYFIRSAFPTQEEVRKVLAALQNASEGLSVPELLNVINLSKGRIEKTLELLALESPAPLAKQGTKWQLTTSPLGGSFWERAERLTTTRQKEHAQMDAYAELSSGHMAYLINALDGEASRHPPLTLSPLATAVDPTLVREAIEFLKRTNLEVPRSP